MAKTRKSQNRAKMNKRMNASHSKTRHEEKQKERIAKKTGKKYPPDNLDDIWDRIQGA